MTNQTKKPENQEHVFTPLRISRRGPGLDNGPAFPAFVQGGARPGMTLWDYFAAHALAGLLSNSSYDLSTDETEKAEEACKQFRFCLPEVEFTLLVNEDGSVKIVEVK